MSIKETLEKIKPFYNLMLILLISSIFFALGRLSVKETQKTPVNIAYSGISQSATAINSSTTVFTAKNETHLGTTTLQDTAVNDGPVVGSKSGKKYYFPWCGTVKRIKAENQVKFNSIFEAKKAGYTPGGNCKGLY